MICDAANIIIILYTTFMQAVNLSFLRIAETAFK